MELALLISFILKHAWASLVPGAGPGAVNTMTNKDFSSGVSMSLWGSYQWWPSETSIVPGTCYTISAQMVLKLGDEGQRPAHKLQCNMIRSSPHF